MHRNWQRCQVGLVGKPPCNVEGDNMAKTKRQGAMLGNSTAVRQLFVRQYTKPRDFNGVR